MRKVSLLPNVITAFGLACGLFVVFRINVLEAEAVRFEVLRTSALIILIAALADLLDGAVARYFKGESEFGVHFDSLADAVTFGVAPPAIILKTLSDTPNPKLAFWAITAGMVYTICGILRLVRFSVKASLAKEKSMPDNATKKVFTGLPIPAAGIAALSANLLLASPEFKAWVQLTDTAETLILVAVMVGLGYFMVSSWKFPALKTFNIKVPSFQLVIATVVVAAFLLYGILHHFALVLVALSWAYLIIAWGLSLARLIAGRRVKVLEDFDFEDDD